MPSNIEIKARIASVQALWPRAAALAEQGPVAIPQDDTFFRCTHGRLKLRTFADGRGELIFYRRADEAGPKASHYLRTPTDAPDALRETLAQACGVVGRVVKHRVLFLAGRTRIHLDDVHGLGSYVELEVVLRDGEAAADGVAEVQALMQALGIEPADLVEGAYVDLLAAGAPAQG